MWFVSVEAIQHVSSASVYTLSSDVATYFEAEENCARMGQRLAVLNTPEKIDEALAQMSGYVVNFVSSFSVSFFFLFYVFALCYSSHWGFP